MRDRLPLLVRCAVVGLLAPVSFTIGCSGDESPPPAAAAAAPVLRPGDSLLDALSAARLDRWTGVALPSAVAALLGPTLPICTPIDDELWREGPELPANNPAAVAAGAHGLKYYTAPARARQRQGPDLPEILRGGEQQAEFLPGRDPLTSGVLWYDAALDRLFALAPAPPRDVSLRYHVLPDAFAGGLPRSEPEPPTAPTDLRRRRRRP
jgi:hypothetical protein